MREAIAVTSVRAWNREHWSLKASEDGTGRSLPRLILKGLRDVNSGIRGGIREPGGGGRGGWMVLLPGGRVARSRLRTRKGRMPEDVTWEPEPLRGGLEKCWRGAQEQPGCAELQRVLQTRRGPGRRDEQH